VHDRRDSYERKESIYQATRCHIAGDRTRNFDIHRSDDLKPPQPIARSTFPVLRKEFQKNLKATVEVVWVINVTELPEWMNGNKKVKLTLCLTN
jgi:hypothetical protein